MDKKKFHIVIFSLVMISAINWGLVGLFNFNFVTYIFGSAPSVEKIVYILVGLSAVYVLVTHKNDCKICSGK